MAEGGGFAEGGGGTGSNYKLSATLEMNDQLTGKLRSAASQLKSIDGAVSKLGSHGEVAKLAQQYKNGQSVVAQMTARHDELKNTFNMSQSATAQLQDKLSGLKVEAAKFKSSGATEEYQKLQQQIKATSAELKASQAMTRSTGAELKTLAGGVKQAQRELAGIGNAFEQSRANAARLKQELKNQQFELNQRRQSLAAQGFNTREFVASERQLRQRMAETSQRLYTEQRLQNLRSTLSAAGMNVSNPRPVQVNVSGNATSTLGKIKNQLNSLTQKSWNVAVNTKNAVGGRLNEFANGAAMGMGAQVMGVAGLGYSAMDAVNTYKEFEYQMATVRAITGANAEEFERLTKRAKELGATTMFKASEVGKAEEYMGMAGWKTKQIEKGLPAVLNLAAASGEDLARVSDIVTDAMTAFGLKATDTVKTADGKVVQATDHFADVMAALATNANTTVGMAGETSKYSAAVVGSLYASQSTDDKMRAVEDWAMMTGIMANAGIKGSMSGTAQRSMLTRLAALQLNANAARESLGVDFTYQQDEIDTATGEVLHKAGQTRRLRDVIGDMRKRFAGDFDPEQLLDMTERLEGKEFTKVQRTKLSKMIENVKAKGGMTDSDKATLTSMMAGQEGMSAWLSVLMASTEDWEKMADAIDKAHGKADEMSKIKMDTLEGDVKTLGSAFEALQLELFEGSGGSGLREFTQGLTDDIRYLQESIKDGFDIGDIGGLLAKVVTQLKDKFLAFDGVGSILAGGALVMGLKKIYDFQKHEERMQSWQSGEFGDSALSKVSKDEINAAFEKSQRDKERQRTNFNQPIAGVNQTLSTNTSSLDEITKASQESARENFKTTVKNGIDTVKSFFGFNNETETAKNISNANISESKIQNLAQPTNFETTGKNAVTLGTSVVMGKNNLPNFNAVKSFFGFGSESEKDVSSISEQKTYSAENFKTTVKNGIDTVKSFLGITDKSNQYVPESVTRLTNEGISGQKIYATSQLANAGESGQKTYALSSLANAGISGQNAVTLGTPIVMSETNLPDFSISNILPEFSFSQWLNEGITNIELPQIFSDFSISNILPDFSFSQWLNEGFTNVEMPQILSDFSISNILPDFSFSQWLNEGITNVEIPQILSDFSISNILPDFSFSQWLSEGFTNVEMPQILSDFSISNILPDFSFSQWLNEGITNIEMPQILSDFGISNILPDFSFSQWLSEGITNVELPQMLSDFSISNILPDFSFSQWLNEGFTNVELPQIFSDFGISNILPDFNFSQWLNEGITNIEMPQILSDFGISNILPDFNFSQWLSEGFTNVELPQIFSDFSISNILPDFSFSQWLSEGITNVELPQIFSDFSISNILPNFNISEWLNEQFVNIEIPDISAMLPDFSAISAPAAEAFNAITSFASEGWASIQAEWNQLPGFFDGIWAGAGDAASAAGSAIASGINSAIGTIQSAWESLSSWLSAKIASLSSMASSAKSAITSFVSGGGIGHNATGTMSWRGGFTEVNELGGEIIDLPSGTRIYPHATTMKMIQRDIENGELNEVGNYFSNVSNVGFNELPNFSMSMQPELSTFPQAISFADMVSSTVNNSNSTTNNNNNSNGFTISGNTFNVRKDTDINEIAFKLMELMFDSQANHAGI